MSSTTPAPSPAHKEHGRSDLNNGSPPQRITGTAAEQGHTYDSGPHSSTYIPFKLSQLNVAKNISPLETSASQRTTSTPFGSSSHNYSSAALTEDMVVHIPGRGNIVAGTTDRRWASTSPATHTNAAKGQHRYGKFVKENLPYRSYRCLNLPERRNPKEPPVEGDPSTYYGTMDYLDSATTYWCDQKGLSYEKAAEIIGRITYEGLRRRHLKALATQFEKYGLKDDGDIPDPKHWVMNRGKRHVIKNSGPQVDADQDDHRTNMSSSVATLPIALKDLVQYTSESTEMMPGQTVPIFVREAPFRQLEMTAIVVCRDLFNMKFWQIQKLMEKSYDFPLSAKEVECCYHATRPAAYGSKYHGYSNVNRNLDQNLLKEKEEIWAAAKALMAISRHGIDEPQSQPVYHQQRPAVKITQSKMNRDTLVLVEPIAERAAASTSFKQPVGFDSTAANSNSHRENAHKVAVQDKNERVAGRENAGMDTKSGNSNVLAAADRDVEYITIDSD